MSRKLQTALIAVVVALALVLGAMIFGLYWYKTNHIFVEGQAYPKDSEYLNLRGSGISVAHYEAIREALPNCRIYWDVPVQGKAYPDDTRSLAVNSLTAEELALLAYLPKLEVIDANGCSDFSVIQSIREAYPQIRVLFHVTVDGKNYDQDATEVTLSALSDAEVEKLGHLPQLQAVHAEGCTDYDQLMRLRELHPECAITYSVSILGQSYPQDTATLSLEKPDQVEELKSQLAYLPALESVHLEEPTAEASSLAALLEAYPELDITWNKTVMGKTYSNKDTTIELNGSKIASLGDVESAMAYFPLAEKVNLGRTNLENEDIAQFREEKRERYKVAWNVKVCGAWISTDDSYFMPVKYNIKVSNDQLGNLVYCEDMLCVDLGHKLVTDLSWLSGMPHLKYLIVAHNNLRNLEPIGQLKELIYLEVWDTWATGYTALYGCTALEDLNVSDAYLDIDLKQFGKMTWLKNLWLNENSATKEEKAYLAEHLPNTNINYDGYSPTAGGWRNLDNYYGMRDLLEMPYNPW